MVKDISVTHAKKLRYLRKLADKKQIEVAEFLSMSQQAYSKLENGDTLFSDETIEKISQFFNISPAEFERPMESIYVGSNNINSGSNIHVVETKLIEALQNIHEQNVFLLEQLLKEKDEQILLLKEKIDKK